MPFELTPEELRVMGCLMEKEATTPEYYPLTLNALVAACNQRTNRFPVTNYTEGDVEQALEGLREEGLVVRVDVAGSRVPKFRHNATSAFGLQRQHRAILSLLLLRGAQTSGELRGRSERLYPFRDLAQVELALGELEKGEAASAIEEPLVAPLPRQPGQKEIRYTHLLGTSVTDESGAIQETPVGRPKYVRAEELDELREELKELKIVLAETRSKLNGLRAEYDEFRKQWL